MAARGELRARVVEVIAQLAPGEVVSYGDVAAQAGYPGAARAVGAVLAQGRHPELPWWRVVNAAGRLAPGLEEEQGRRLAAEGVAVAGGRVVRRRSGVVRASFRRRPRGAAEGR